MDQQISDRRQGPKEPIRVYTTALLTLLRRRGGYDNERIMETLYYNMKPGLRLHIRLIDVSTLEELIQHVQEIEEVKAQLPRDVPADNRTATKTRRPAHLLQSEFIRGECCWRCEQRGHNYFKCPNQRKKFCSWCGKEDLFTRD